MGRSLVLERMLDKDVLFPDREFRDRLETQARANMTAEIASLAEG
jgi:predicted metal-dependent HD superfamily phosphohydrolase